MEWQILASIGALASAFATLFAGIIALYVGTRPYRKKLFARALFYERDDLPVVEHHPNCLCFECVNIGNQPIYLSYVLERPRFERSIKGFVGLVASKRKTRTITIVGKIVPDIKVPRYWHYYSMGDVLKVTPGQEESFVVPFDYIRKVQEARAEKGIFNLEKRLRFYVVDITGKKYRVRSGAYPNTFLEERTCHVNAEPLF